MLDADSELDLFGRVYEGSTLKYLQGREGNRMGQREKLSSAQVRLVPWPNPGKPWELGRPFRVPKLKQEGGAGAISHWWGLPPGSGHNPVWLDSWRGMQLWAPAAERLSALILKQGRGWYPEIHCPTHRHFSQPGHDFSRILTGLS